jgi:hypothetical protein
LNTIDSKTEWNALLKEEFAEYNDVFLTYEYFEVYMKHYRVKPEGIFWENGSAKIFWTHLVRDLDNIPLFKGTEYHDLVTPYGYGGPLFALKNKNQCEIEEATRKFFDEYESYCKRNNYVSEFVRFHPLFNNWKIWEKIVDIEHLNDVVMVDLTISAVGAWDKINREHRQHIRKMNGQTYEVEILLKPTAADIENFTSLYYETMNRNKALEKYYFPIDVIKDYFDLLNSFLIRVKYENEVIGASIFIYGGKTIHYYLTGSLPYRKGIYPNDLIIWEAIKWVEGKSSPWERPFTQLNLGGGRGKNDGIFSFKHGFSDKTVPFFIGKIIFDKEAYCKLERMNPQSSSVTNDYFPSYRRGLDTTIV